MSLIVQIIIGLILAIHIYIFLLETVLFRKRGWKVFGFSRDHVELLRPIVSNQGCYNGFIVMALSIVFMHPNPEIARAFAYYGLISVALAGVWGSLTIMRNILFIQTLPAVLGLLALVLL